MCSRVLLTLHFSGGGLLKKVHASLGTYGVTRKQTMPMMFVPYVYYIKQSGVIIGPELTERHWLTKMSGVFGSIG